MTSSDSKLLLRTAALRAIRRALRQAGASLAADSALRDDLALAERLLVRLTAADEAAPAVAASRASLDASCTARIADLAKVLGSQDRSVRWAAYAELAAMTGDAAFFGEQQEALVEQVAAETMVAAHMSSAAYAVPTVAQLQLFFTRRFAGHDLRVLAAEAMPGGRSKLTLRVALQANKVLPAQLVLRCDRPGSAQDTQVAVEHAVMQAAFAQGLPVAEPLFLESDASGIGTSFMAMRMIEGKVPGSYWSAVDVPPALGFALAGILARLHRVAARKIWPDSITSAADNVAMMLADLAAKSRPVRVTPSIAAESALVWLAHELPCIDGGAVAIHGDAHFGNVLAAGDQITGLTDWEFAHAGHPAEDLAFCRGYIESIMPWPDFLTAYRAAGGIEVSERQLRFFRLWSQLRNLTMTTKVIADLQAGATPGLQDLSHALHARPKLSTLLARGIADSIVMQADDA